MKVPLLPSTPIALEAWFCAIFPDFKVSVIHDDEWPLTFHAVWMEFKPFVHSQAQALTKEQIDSLSGLINLSVLSSGTIENAVSTVFLEHLRGGGLYQRLRPQLSALARSKTHA